MIRGPSVHDLVQLTRRMSGKASPSRPRPAAYRRIRSSRSCRPRGCGSRPIASARSTWRSPMMTLSARPRRVASLAVLPRAKRHVDAVGPSTSSVRPGAGRRDRVAVALDRAVLRAVLGRVVEEHRVFHVTPRCRSRWDRPGAAGCSASRRDGVFGACGQPWCENSPGPDVNARRAAREPSSARKSAATCSPT